LALCPNVPPRFAADLTTLGNTARHGFTDHEHLDGVNLIHMKEMVGPIS